MALFEGTHREYYQGNDFGNYQFISLNDIITQFQIAYIGEDKIISKARRADIAFHAQRALQELSFDTFKSIKSYQIDMPSTLVMPLPHDYVNYTKISWVDGNGTKHRMYPHTSTTNNPFQIHQDDNGDYVFPEGMELLVNSDFSESFNPPWYSPGLTRTRNVSFTLQNHNIVDGVLTFNHTSSSSWGEPYWSKAHAVWQAVDVSSISYVNLEGNGSSLDAGDGYTTIRLGLSSTPGDSDIKNFSNATHATASANGGISLFDVQTVNGEVGYMEWTAGDTGEKEILVLDVSNLNTVYVLVTSSIIYSSVSTATSKSTIDDISLKNTWAIENLTTNPGNEIDSSTWNNYKAGNLSSSGVDNSLNTNPTVDVDNYFRNTGQRYGLDPQHAQANGSFFIDPRLGRIHFSSNVNGKPVILDYISDSLGTDEEMQVHKFAEEAMYKWIAHAVLSTRANTPEYIVNRFKKERFAAIRNAKLRLSNIKLAEITQVLRGKSKLIKH